MPAPLSSQSTVKPKKPRRTGQRHLKSGGQRRQNATETIDYKQRLFEGITSDLWKNACNVDNSSGNSKNITTGSGAFPDYHELIKIDLGITKDRLESLDAINLTHLASWEDSFKDQFEFLPMKPRVSLKVYLNFCGKICRSVDAKKIIISVQMLWEIFNERETNPFDDRRSSFMNEKLSCAKVLFEIFCTQFYHTKKKYLASMVKKGEKKLWWLMGDWLIYDQIPSRSNFKKKIRIQTPPQRIFPVHIYKTLPSLTRHTATADDPETL